MADLPSTRPQKDETADDWLSNFNDLSIEAEAQSSEKNGNTSDKSRKARKRERDQERKDISSETVSREGTSFEGLKAKLGYAANARAKASLKSAELDDISSRALEGIPKDAKSTDHASPDVRQAYESVLAGFMNAPTSTATSNARDDAAELSGKAFVGRKARLANAQKWPGTKRLPIPSETSDDHQIPQVAKKKAGAGSTSAVDDILVAGGGHASSKKTAVQPEDLHHGKPISIASKARVVRERPKWGGMTAAPVEAGPAFKASFDSLQRADKVSAPPQRPSTAFSAEPWGFKEVQANKASIDSPSDIAAGRDSESADTTPARAKREEPQSDSLSGMLGFAKLKNMLYGSNSETKKTEAVEPEEAEPSSTSAQHEDRKGAAQLETDNHHNAVVSVEISSNTEVTRTSEQEQSSSKSPLPPRLSKRANIRARQKAIRRRVIAAEVAAASSMFKAEKAPTLAALHESTAVDLPEDENPDSILQRHEDDGRSVSDAVVGRETLDSMLQSSEDTGRSMSDAMLGRDLSAAMSSEQGPEHATEEYYVDDAESGLPLVEAKDLQITALDIKQPPVPELSYGLDRVLFNPGVTWLQDQHSRVYNFDPYLQNVMPVEEFDFNALQEYKTSSQDSMLSELAKAHGKKYVGSTSSMTSTLSHFHYLLSGWRDLNLGMLSRQFPEDRCVFTAINRAPTAIFLRWKNGTYAIDADKEFDSGNILMMLGKSMEKLLTLPKSEYERYRKSDPREITEEERNAPEAYQYTTMGDFLMRSQLDAYDPRLPGTGMFDIKTRSIASIRMSTTDYKPMLGYEILTQQGAWESYEREYYDMMRSTMLKYMLQARMGRMDGIFLAYHNIERIFGFQYMPISEIDRAIHGQIDRCLGDQEFKISLDLLNKVLEEATAKFPNRSLRMHFETRTAPVPAMYVFAEPMEEEQIDKIQSKSKGKIAEFERKMMGIEASEENAKATEHEFTDNATPSPLREDGTHAPLYAATILVGSIVNGERVERPTRLTPEDDWSVEYLFKEMEDPAAAWATYAQCKAKREKVFSRAIMTDEEGGAESLDTEPNSEMYEHDGSLRTFESFFHERLRRMAEKGREYRKKVNELEKETGKIVYAARTPTVVDSTTPSQAPPKVAPTVSSSGAPSINTVDEYMSWMYGNKENRAPATTAATTSAEPEITGVDDYMSWMYKDRAS
ncbi:hypothetical protein MBLNU13_g05709t1 [Cladosporium sp. NU13]